MGNCIMYICQPTSLQASSVSYSGGSAIGEEPGAFQALKPDQVQLETSKLNTEFGQIIFIISTPRHRQYPSYSIVKG